MSNYENAPGTKLLATRCAVCARPLLDAVSVELGIGPDCRKKFYTDKTCTKHDDCVQSQAVGGGVSAACAAERAANREQANQIVHAIAIAQTDAAVIGPGCDKLRVLGFADLAARILDRVVKIRITEAGGTLTVEAPYVSEDVASRWRNIPGRRWDKQLKANLVPVTEKARLWAFLRMNFAGAFAVGPKGTFQVGV